MREVLDSLKDVGDILKGVEKILEKADGVQSLLAKVYLAHAGVAFARARLALREEQKEETCES